MQHRRGTTAAFSIALCVMLASTRCKAEQPVRLPPEVAELLSAAQSDLEGGRHAEAIRRLNAFLEPSIARAFW